MLTVNGTDIAPGSPDFERDDRPHQVRNVMADGTARVRDTQPAENFVTFKLPRISNTAMATLRTLITVTANYAANNITVVDDYGEAWTGKYWDKSFKSKRRLGRFWSASFKVRLS